MNRDFIDDHDIGDTSCKGCWREETLKCVCGGTIHQEFGDYTSEDSYYLLYWCEKCGMEYEVEEE